jgi:hypothetical protein
MAQQELEHKMYGTTLEDRKAIKDALHSYKDGTSTYVLHMADHKVYKVLNSTACRCPVNDTQLKIETGWFAIEQFKLAHKE